MTRGGSFLALVPCAASLNHSPRLVGARQTYGRFRKRPAFAAPPTTLLEVFDSYGPA